MKTAGAIIPIFNEEKTVAKVINAVLDSKLFSEVIVVNDCSTDGSMSLLRTFKSQIRIICLPKNKGKGNALAAGIDKSKQDIVVFIDADINNLCPKFMIPLIKPLITGKARAVVGCEKVGIANPFFLQGERAYYRKDLLPYLSQMKTARFGIELLLDEISKKNHWKVKHIHLKGIKKPLKFAKIGFNDKALLSYLKEFSEIAEVAARIQKRTAVEKIAFRKKILANLITGYFHLSKAKIRRLLSYE